MREASERANQVLQKYGIDPNDAVNGMYLPNKMAKDLSQFDVDTYGKASEYGPQHPPLVGDENIHCRAYVEAVRDRLVAVENRGEQAVRDELQKIAQDIMDRKFPGVPPLPDDL